MTVQAEGGHYTLVTVETNQVGESEADKLAKRFLTLVHTMAEPTIVPSAPTDFSLSRQYNSCQ